MFGDEMYDRDHDGKLDWNEQVERDYFANEMSKPGHTLSSESHETNASNSADTSSDKKAAAEAVIIAVVYFALLLMGIVLLVIEPFPGFVMLTVLGVITYTFFHH